MPFPKEIYLLEYLQIATLSWITLSEDGDAFQYINSFRQLQTSSRTFFFTFSSSKNVFLTLPKWNELSIVWNDLTLPWNDLTVNQMAHIYTVHACINTYRKHMHRTLLMSVTCDFCSACCSCHAKNHTQLSSFNNAYTYEICRRISKRLLKL